MSSPRRTVKPIALALAIALTAALAPSATHVVEAAGGGGPIQYTYDANGRLTGVIDPASGSAAYAYDAAGNITGITRKASTVVTVLELTPDRGAIGSQVTIEGVAFSATASQDTVKFNGTTASIVSASTTKLVVTVPAGATSGTVSVTAPGGTASSPAPFTIGSPGPSIASFSPGIVAVGDTVTINGAGFDPAAGANVVGVAGIRQTITSTSATVLAAKVGQTGSGKIAVATGGGNVTSSSYVFITPAGRAVSDIDSTGVLTLGVSQALSVPAGKTMLRVFEGTVGQHLSLNMPANSSMSGPVTRPDGSQLFVVGTGPAFYELPILPVSGTFTVALTNYQASAWSGQIELDTIAADVTAPITVDGQPVIVTIAAPAQNAQLTFTGSIGQRVIARIQPVGPNIYSKLSIMAPDGGPVVVGTLTQNPILTGAVLPEAGPYTLVVDPSGTAVGQVSVTLYTDPGDATAALPMNSTIPMPAFIAGQNVAVTFSGIAGHRVSIDVSTYGAYSVDIVVRNPDGSTLEGSPSWGSVFPPVTLPATGTYTIFIDPYYAQTGGGFVGAWDVPADITQSMAIGDPTVNVTLVPGQQADLTFAGTAGGVISLATLNGISSDIPNLSIKDPDGNDLVNPTGMTQTPFVPPVTMPTSGTYTIHLDPGPYGPAATTTYAIHLYNVPPDDTGTMTVGGPTATVTNTAPGQNMSRTFNGTAGQRVSVAVTVLSGTYPRALAATIKILKPDGSNLWGPLQDWAPPNGKFMEPALLPASGTYTIVIDPNYETTMSYRLGVYVPPADETGLITVGGAAVTATNTVPGQNMLRTFSCTSGQKVKLTADTFTFQYGTFSILNPNGSQAGGSWLQSPSGIVTATVSAAGTCTIKVDPDMASIGSVRLILVNNPSGFQAPTHRRPKSHRPAKPEPRPSPATTPGAAATPEPDVTPPGAQTGDSKDDRWTPSAAQRGEDWRAHRPSTSWEDVPLLKAPHGVTALSGRVLSLGGRPLEGATLSLNSHSTTTDASGRFLLTGIEPGHQELVVDGNTTTRARHVFGMYEIGVEVDLGHTTKLGFTIWMTALDTANEVSIPERTTTETVITTPSIPGLELHIPAGSKVIDDDGHPVTKIGLTAIPLDRPPFPLPKNTEPPIYFTIQPGLAYVSPRGAQIVYPNYTGLRPGTRTNFWQYDPDGKGWFIYGTGTVTADGRQVVPDRGTRIYEFTGAMFGMGQNPPGDGPCPGCPADGDPVDLSSGLFVLSKTDLVASGPMPISITRTYRPNDTDWRAFGPGTNFNYGFFLSSAHYYTEVDLVLPDGGRVHYVRTSPGTGWTDAIFRSTTTPGRYYGSQVFFNGNGWDVKLKDGTVYVFGDNAPLQSIRDRNGNTTTLIRPGGAGDRIARIQGSNGRWIDLGYDGSGRISSATDNAGRTVGYTYDASGYLWKVTDPNGGVTEYTYDPSGRMLTLKDARGITFLTNEYDANGRVRKQTQADNTTYQFAYVTDGNGKVIQTDVTDPRGFVRRLTFNASGFELTNTSAFGTPNAQTTTTVRQADGNLPTSVTDPLGRRTDYAYDASGNLLSQTRLAGTANALTTTTTYEPRFDLPATVTDPLSHATTFKYNATGTIRKIVNELGKETTFTYNPAGQPLTITDPTGKTTSYSYFMGDVVGVTDPLGHTTTRFIDDAGRTAGTTNPLGASSSVVYDVLNRPTKVTDALGGATRFSYDANGNILTLTDARGGVTTSTYDAMDRSATTDDPLHHLGSFTYDAAGNLLTATDRTGQVTSYRYDELGRRTFVGYKTVTVGQSTTYESTVTSTYDAGNRLRTLTDSGSGTITYDYDDLDRLTSETSPQGTITYAHDAAGRRTRQTLAGQPDVIYAYDAANRPTTITQGTDQVAFTFDDAGRRLTMTLPGSIIATYAYDDAGHVTSIVYKKGTTTVGDLTYTYNADGRKSVVGGSLAGTVLPTALASATYDAANELTSWGGSTLTYDANGSLTHVVPVGAPADTQAPSLPVLTATANGPKRVDLSWTASTDNVAVSRYTISRGGTPLISVAGTATSFTDWSAAPATTYSYTVTAADAAGNSTVSTAKSATTPVAGSTFASDAFNRTLSGSWGPADVGGTWTGTDTTFSVAPGAGKVTLASATNKNANLTTVAARDQEVLVKLNVNKLVTGGDTTMWVALRRQDTSNFYSARVLFKSTHAISLQFVRTSAGTATTIGSGTASPTHVAADSYWLRVQISGTTSTNGKVRLWKAGTTEPTTWTVNSTDAATPTALRGNGHVGVRFQVAGSGFPIVGSFSNLAITSIGGAPPPDLPGPTTPAGLSATAVSSSQVNLSWTASTDNVGVQGYKVARNGAPLATVGTTTWSDTGLNPSTAYSYTVTAIDGANNASGASNTANATTQAAGADTTYTWNARHELVQIKTGTTVTASFAYDVTGRRISRTVAGNATGFAYGGTNAIQEKAGANPTANMLTGGTDQLFKRTDSVGTRMPLTDDLGSVVALVDSAGALKTNYTYGPYGQTTMSGEANANPTQFTGRENDGTGLYFYRARYYDPALGRFISQDPAGIAGGGPNLYAYVGGDPINATDSSGRWIDTIIDIAFVAMDLWNLATGSRKDFEGNMLALGMDLLGMALPFVTGLGAASRAVREADNLVDATAQVLKNQVAGNAFRDLTASQLRDYGFRLVGTEVRVNTGLGTRVVDILAERNGFLHAFETKLGQSRYLPTQRAKDAWIERIGGTLTDGTPIQFITTLIRG